MSHEDFRGKFCTFLISLLWSNVLTYGQEQERQNPQGFSLYRVLCENTGTYGLSPQLYTVCCVRTPPPKDFDLFLFVRTPATKGFDLLMSFLHACPHLQRKNRGKDEPRRGKDERPAHLQRASSLFGCFMRAISYCKFQCFTTFRAYLFTFKLHI